MFYVHDVFRDGTHMHAAGPWEDGGYATRLKTHRLFQVDIDRREQCCAANYEQVVNHVVPSCYS
jgi:hypothetical protein